MSNIQKVPVFSTYKPFLHILTIYDWKNFHNQDRRILKRNICLAIVVSILALAFIVAMVCDAWFCVTNNFNVVEIGSAFGILINAVQFAITYNSIRMKSDLVNQLIAGMNKIINERCAISPRRAQHYEKLEKRFAWFTAIGVHFSIWITVSFFAVSSTIPILYAVFGFPQPNRWAPMFQFYIPLPSGTNVFLQFYLDWTDQMLTSLAYYVMLCTIALFFIGMCIYIGGMVEDLRLTLAELEDDPATTTTQLVAEIEFHNQLLDIAKSVGDIMSAGLLFQLLVCAVSLAVYMVAMESNGNLSASFWVCANALAVTVLSTYAYCYLSEYVTHNLNMIGDYFYECAWYRLPVEQQKLFILPIQRAQLEFRIDGLGFVECSLRVFTSIMRATWSYFLLMHGSKQEVYAIPNITYKMFLFNLTIF